MDAGGCFLTRALHNTKEEVLPEEGRGFKSLPVSEKRKMSGVFKNISSRTAEHGLF